MPRPYYTHSQHSRVRPNCSSLEFWRWFDNKCTPEERAWVNDAPNGPETIERCKQVIAKQGGWAHVQGRE